jgi:hypothetical protein
MTTHFARSVPVRAYEAAPDGATTSNGGQVGNQAGCQVQLAGKSALKPLRSALKRTQPAANRTEAAAKRTDFFPPVPRQNAML